MGFRFVDGIVSMDDKVIHGYLDVDTAMVYRRKAASGADYVSPGIIAEALGQLASWKLLHDNDFRARPVFLFAESIDHEQLAPIGVRLELRAEIDASTADAARFSAQALLDAKPICTVTSCALSYFPLEQLEDPKATRQRFFDLKAGLPTRDLGFQQAFSWDQFAGQVLEQDGHTQRRLLTMQVNWPFYVEHFPQRPITPIVILNEMAGQGVKALMGAHGSIPWHAYSIRDCKIRDFVCPGESIEIRTKMVELDVSLGRAKVQVEVVKGQRTIMRALWLLRQSLPEPLGGEA